MGPVMRTVVACFLVVAVAACTGSPVSRVAGEPRSATSRSASTTPNTPTTRGTPVVNGRITTVQRQLGRDVGSYHWLAFDNSSSTGLFVSYRSCRQCRPRHIDVARLTVVGPAGRLATTVCSDRPPCRARRNGNAATLGPAADEVTVESGDRSLSVIGYDGTLRRTIDLTDALARRDDVGGLAWSPDGGHLAVLTHRGRRGTDFWLVEGDEPATLAYTFGNPFAGHAAWSPDGASLVFEALLPSRRHRGWIRDTGADVVVLHRSPEGRPPAMTLQTRYRSDRHFDWAGNIAWSPDGTRIAVRTGEGVVEISAQDGDELARHPQTRKLGGWLIWVAGHR